MKKILFTISLVAVALLSDAQIFEDGKNVLMLGFGLPPSSKIKNTYDKEYSKYIDYKFKNYGTVVLRFEHGLHKHFGLGINAEYSGASVSYKYDATPTLRYQNEIKSTIIGTYLRLNAHLPIGEKFDVYGGAGMGYLYTFNKHNDTNPNTELNHKTKVFEFDYQFSLGARLMVKESIGVFGEVGSGTTLFQLGLAFGF